ncbi:MAG: hypothetical protein J6R85_01135, partial [Lentisphaeria bacterium]|nr:hypothetical protein [Lentisphaeria bacterium]
ACLDLFSSEYRARVMPDTASRKNVFAVCVLICLIPYVFCDAGMLLQAQKYCRSAVSLSLEN